MALRKCPKCEVNYLRGTETICAVCRSQMKKHGLEEEAEEEILCTNCGEKPAVKGKDLCEDCLKEQERQEELEAHADAVRMNEVEDPVEENIAGLR